MEHEEALVGIETAQLLVNLGLLASWERLNDHSDVIFSGVISAYPDLAAVRVSYGVTLVASNRYAEALALLEQVCREYPMHMMGKSALAMVHKEMGNGQWRSLVTQVINNGQDEAAVELAQALLNENTKTAQRQASPTNLGVQFA
jgi:predicted Zn-dependent protease